MRAYRKSCGRHAHYPWTAADDTAIRALVLRGASNSTIGAALGRSEWSIKWRRRLIGIPTGASK